MSKCAFAADPWRALARECVLALPLILCTVAAASAAQRSLAVVSAGPTGEIASLAEANEVRVIFSEPMVTLGRIPRPVRAPFFQIAPAVRGTFRWSGTTILIFTPDERRPLPLGTRFEVTIDTTATAVSGRRLEKAYTFAFITPTVRLLSAEWYRKNAKFTDPVIVALRFNQPVHAAQVATHLSLAFARHDWTPPPFTPPALARLKATNPRALAAFDAKVAATRAVAASEALVLAVPAAQWNTKQYPPSRDLVVLEVTTPAPPESWIRLVLDTKIAGMAGKETPSAPQEKILELEHAFFVTGFRCTAECDPDDYNPITFSRGELTPPAVAKHVKVTDITDAASATTVTASKPQRGRAPDESEQYDASTDFTLEDLGFEHAPARTFAVTLASTLQLPDGQALGYDWLGVVENWHKRAFTSFGDGHGVWESAGGSVLPFYALNFQDARQWVSPVAPADLVPTMLRLQGANFSLAPDSPARARRLAPSADKVQSYGLDLSAALSKSATGLAWAAVEEGTPIPRSKPIDKAHKVRSTLVQVTNLGISLKYSPQNTLVFVTRLDNGRPVARADVELVTLDNTVVWKGTTDAHGVAIAPDTRRICDSLSSRRSYAFLTDLRFVVVARLGSDVAYVGSNWTEGIQPWEFGAAFDPTQAEPVARGSVFTDRGVYKLGEEVHVKAVLREDAPAGVRLLQAGRAVHVVVNDSQDKPVDRRSVTVNEWSSAEWTFTVPADGPLGDYTITASLQGPGAGQQSPPADRQGAEEDAWLKTVTGSFLVAAYRRPEFRVDLELSGPSPLAGDPVGGAITAKYLFGGPMAGRPVRWSLTRHPLFSAPEAVVSAYEQDRFVFGGDYPWEANLEVAADHGTLDPKGIMQLQLQTTAGVDRPYRYVLEAEVEDLSRQKVANRAEVVVSPAPWYVGVRMPDYFADAAKGVDTQVVAVDGGGKRVPGVAVRVSLTHVQWHSVRRAEGRGFYTWETEKKETEAGAWDVTSAAGPVPLHVPLPEGGYYTLTARATDAQGHATRTTISFYGVGVGYTAWERYDHNRIDLVPERKTYKPGDTARVMIKSPWEQATALVTTEREGVRTQRQFVLTSTQQAVDVPVTEEDIPNVFVSVLLVKGRTKDASSDDESDPGKPAFRLGYAELKVEDASKRLQVRVTPGKEEYRPADAGKVSVEVRDAAGTPARAEVTLWAVDHGVLSLTGFRTPDVLSSVYIEKALQVATADSRQRIVSRRVLTPKGAAEGGGGGAEQSAGTMRKDFRVLAFWVGSVVTNKDGRAAVDVKMPESLTTYRIMAVAGDKASRFGRGESEIRVNKPLMLRAAFPRFLAVGDTGFFGAVVNSQLKTGGEATVAVKSLDPSVLEFAGEAAQKLEIGPRGAAEARFGAQAKAIGRARVQMTVKLGNETDAFEDVIPVEILRSPETVAAYGETTGEAVERVTVPAGAVPTFGGLRVGLSSTALVGLGEGARYLVEYPYGCAEQRSSRTLALMLAADLGDAFKLPGIDAANARARVQESLRELGKFQCSDGAFAYWAGECGSRSEYLSAYLLHVFHVAEAMKYEVDKEVVERGLDFLKRRMAEPPPVNEAWWPSYTAWQAFAAKVLVEAGVNQDSNVNRLYGYLDRMPVFAVAYLHDALVAKGEQGPRIAELERRIRNSVLSEGGSAHVEELPDPYLLWFWNSNVRSTAISLASLLKRGGESDGMVRPMVRWLMTARKKGRWDNTQENALAMEALVAYYRKFEAETPDFSARVSLGARELTRVAFRGRSTETRANETPMPQLLGAAPAGSDIDLRFAREGTGTLFYEAQLRYTSNELFTQGLDNGFRVERSYAVLADKGVKPPPPATSFQAGDLVRVTLTFTVPKERRYVAVSDPLPAGFEPIESWFATTASDLAKEQRQGQRQERGWFEWWQRGGFDHVERHDDRVLLFATRLAEGRHVFSYVVRATTAGTFRTAPTHAEEMYEPEVFGRTATVVVEVRR